MTQSLGEVFPVELARCRELLVEYEKIPTGGFGAAVIRDVLARADAAAADSDIIKMVQTYNEMKTLK